MPGHWARECPYSFGPKAKPTAQTLPAIGYSNFNSRGIPWHFPVAQRAVPSLMSAIGPAPGSRAAGSSGTANNTVA